MIFTLRIEMEISSSEHTEERQQLTVNNNGQLTAILRESTQCCCRKGELTAG